MKGKRFMLTPKFLIFLAIGTLCMLIPMMFIGHWYRIRKWKIVISVLLLTASGVFGTYFWYFVENFEIAGRSFYGAVFIVPLFFFIVGKILRSPYGQILDLCAPAECVMLVLMKALCFIEGCCGGRVLWVNASGNEIVFPSQLAELLNAVLVFVLLMILAYRKKNQGMLYPWYLVIYGASRFILNFFRQEWVTTQHFVPLGTVWSVLAFAIGISILFFHKKQTNKKTA